MSRKGALSQSSFLLRFSVERNPADTKDHIFKPGHYSLFLKSHLNIYVSPKYFTTKNTLCILLIFLMSLTCSSNFDITK